MKEKILAALKTKYKSVGLSEKALEQVADYLGLSVVDEAGIEPAVNGAELLLKAFQSDIDKRVTDAVAKAKAELPKPPEPPAPEPPKPPVPPKPDDTPEWAKGLIARIDGIEKQAKQSSLIGTVKQKLAEKKVPESYLRGRNLSVEKDEDIETLVKQIETDYTEFRQDLVNQGVIISTPAEAGGSVADSAIAKQIAERRNNPGAATEGVTAKKLI